MPMASIITCSYKRAKFLPNMINMVRRQDYPHDRLEWVIMDDSPETSAGLFRAHPRLSAAQADVPDSASYLGWLDGIKVRYYYLREKVKLAKKRDLLNFAAEGEFLVNMDDDDYYPPCRVSHAISKMIEAKTQLAGSSKMFMYFTRDHTIYQLGPYRENHGTGATLAYTKEFARSHYYYRENDSTAGKNNYAEEGEFTENWKYPMVQLDPMKTVLALSHTDNTIEKTMFLEERYGHIGRTVHESKLQLADFVNKEAEADVYDFYRTLSYEYKENNLTREVMQTMEDNSKKAQEQYQQIMVQRMVTELQQEYMRYQKLMLLVHQVMVEPPRIQLVPAPPPQGQTPA
jgi:glycosyltransferase involved in cell wall biosynthesis